jgi:sirohydrochlorin cobaltochelatase
MPPNEAAILIGHGGIASDTPREFVAELKQLESARRQRGETVMCEREAELDSTVRRWPRTAMNDPYKAGLEAVAGALRKRLGDVRLVVAYNEFCAPSIDEAIDGLVNDGMAKITLVTTMITPGGSHSGQEIPELIEAARRRHAAVEINYAWPFDLGQIADFISTHLKTSSS